jgi:hypothetical protein
MVIAFVATAAGKVIALPWAVVVFSALGAAVLTLGGVSPPTSRWRVPRGWAYAGDLPYSALFGVILGVGVLTLVGSYGFFVILLGSAYGGLAWAIPSFSAFAFARMLPTVSALHESDAERVTATASRLISRRRHLQLAEALLVLALAATMIAAH